MNADYFNDPRDLDDDTAEAVAAGLMDAGQLSRVVGDFRLLQATEAPRMSDGLRAAMATAGRPRARLVARLAGMSAAAYLATAASAAAATVIAAGSVGALPDQAQDAFRSIVRAVTPFDPPAGTEMTPQRIEDAPIPTVGPPTASVPAPTPATPSESIPVPLPTPTATVRPPVPGPELSPVPDAPDRPDEDVPAPPPAEKRGAGGTTAEPEAPLIRLPQLLP